MGKSVFKDAYVLLNSVNLSNRVKDIQFSQGADAVEQTAMGETTHNFMPGLLTADFSITFYQDEATSEVESTLSTILSGGVAVAIEIRPTSAARSATNPAWTGNVMLESFDAVAGSVGQAYMCKANFKPAGTISRVTS